jgi:hypothetical protein
MMTILMNSRNSKTYDYEYTRNKENKHIYDIRVQSKKKVDLDHQKRSSDRLISKMETLIHEVVAWKKKSNCYGKEIN